MIPDFNKNYEIISIIGKGGMSTVYLAEHKRLHTKWAVKEVLKDPDSPVDFLAESNILKRLHHPSLPQIIDIFEDNERVIIVEDFVEGQTMKDYIKKNSRVDERQGIAWFKELCTVLIYLHSQKPNPIIYRDMKPANIMVTPDNTLKLIDFGIAREFKHDSSADTTYIGTKGYAAPEQFGTAQTDVRTDIYSLGVTMYHLFSGKSPYDPPYGFVPIRELVPSLSGGTEIIIDKCVRPEPQDRYQSVEELLDDIEHIYKYDIAYKKRKRAKRIKITALIAALLASFALVGAGVFVVGREKEDRFKSLLMTAEQLYHEDYDDAIAALDEARSIFPERLEPYRMQTYALYYNGEWQKCENYGTEVISSFGNDAQIRLTMACAQFELGNYEAAAEGFEQGGYLSTDNLRDYAVCLGRMGDVDKGEDILARLIDSGADSVVTEYVHGEMCAAKEDYVTAETSFLSALRNCDSNTMLRRCYTALGNIYQKCAVLQRTSNSPIPTPATKSVEILSQAVVLDAMRYDSVIWEMLAMAYFESYHTDTEVPAEYLTKAGECFNRVIELGVTKGYLYTNLYTIYYEAKDYEKALETLAHFEKTYPDDYTPKALRAMLFITVENEKDANVRDYSAAYDEYVAAEKMIRSSDDATYYQQLETLINNLKNNNWL